MVSFKDSIYYTISAILIGLACSAPPMPDSQNSQIETLPRSPIEILKDLKSPQTVERRNAILECLEYSIRECIPELRRLIRDEDPGIRSVSAIGLGEFRDIESIPAIVRLKKDRDIFPDNILDALTRMRHPSIGIHVIEYLDYSDHTVRLLAVEALKTSQAKSQAPDVLRMALKNQDSDKAKTFAMALGYLDYKPSEDYLIRLLKSEEDGPTKAAAILALGRLRSKKATPLLLTIFGSDYLKGRENAYISLRDTKDNNAFRELIKFLNHSEREVRFLSANIITQLDTIDNRKKVRELFQSALSQNSQLSLAPVATILGEWKDEASREAIESLVINPSSADREDLAKSLGWLGNPKSEDVLLKILEENSGDGRYGAAWSLGFLGGEKSVNTLIEKAQSSDRKLAILSIEALGNLKSDKSIQTFVKLSKDDNLAPFAISSLSVIPGEVARKEIENLALSKRTIQSKLAIEALGQRGELSSKTTLEGLTQSKDPEIRKLARFALKNLMDKSEK